MRAFLIVSSFVLGGVCAFYATPLVYNNQSAINILITVYSVFAGFLVAIIAVVGDSTLIPSGSWRVAEHNRGNLEKRIIRYSYLFWLYLLTIALIFLGVVFKDAPDTIISLWWKMWIARAYLFFGVSAFLLSLGLPKALKDSQKMRISEEIKRRRSASGIKDED